MNNIPRLELGDKNDDVSFVYKTMEQVDAELQTSEVKEVPHRHNYYTVLWSINATGTHDIDFDNYPIEKGSVFFVAPNQVHSVHMDQNPSGFVLLFSEEFLQNSGISNSLISDLKLFKDFSDNTPFKIPINNERILHIFNEIAFWYSSEDSYKLEAIGGLLKLFFVHCHTFNHGNTSNEPKIDSGKQLLRNFKTLVEENFYADHKVKQYADNLNITAGYLNEVSHKYIGVSAKEYIFNRILTEAKRLIHFTDLSAKEIAFALGFDDPSHFAKWFKQKSGHTFSDFKKLPT